jgi:hypothetical protein
VLMAQLHGLVDAGNTVAAMQHDVYHRRQR